MRKHIIRFDNFMKRLPLWSRVAIASVILALMWMHGEHTGGGVVFSVVTLARNEAYLSYGGGDQFLIKQVHRKTDGTFEALTGTDCLGGTGGTTWHDILSLVSSNIERQEDGSHKCTLQGIEDDLARKMFALKVAPYSRTAPSPRPALTLENGTKVVLQNSQEDTTRPYFQIMKYEFDPVAQFGSWFFGVGQFSRATKRADKDNTLVEKDFSFFTVDALAYVCEAKSGITVTAPTLSGGLAHGTYVDATA